MLLATALACAAPVWAQPDPITRPPNGLPFRLVSPAEAEKMVVPRPIQLKLDDVSVARALEELQAQSGVAIDLSDLRYSPDTLGKRLSIDIETPSFNRAFDEIMDKAGLRAKLRRQGYGRFYRVDFNPGGEAKSGLVFTQGLFSVQLSTLENEIVKEVDTSNAKIPVRTENRTLTAELTMLPDTRLPLTGTTRLRVTRAEDDQGRSLPTVADEYQYLEQDSEYFYSSGYSQRHRKLKLRAPAPDAKMLRHLEGVVIYSWIDKSEKWRVPDLLAQPQWTREFENGAQRFSMSVRAARVKGDPNRVGVTIEVSSDLIRTPDEILPAMLASSPIMETLVIQDAKGTPLHRNGGFASKGYHDGKLVITATFDSVNADDEGTGAKALATPLQMTFVAPLDVVQTEAPFAFENVPLP